MSIKTKLRNTFYNILDHRKIKKVKVLSLEDTLNLLLSNPKSFARFGDGEIEIMKGHSIPFQDYDKRLSSIMMEIISHQCDSLYVGLNYYYFHDASGLNQLNKEYYLNIVPKFRHFLLKHYDKNNTYISAQFNQLYMFLDDQNIDAFYDKILNLFKDKEVVLFLGQGILDNLKHDVFQKAKSVEKVYYKSKNAFDDFDEILAKAKTYPKEKLLCFILGPTSKALVYELAKLSYLAYDIGHLAKDYDAYKNKIEKSAENIDKFYKPD